MTLRSMKTVTASVALVLGLGVAHGQNMPDPLRSGFDHPPASARPMVWWHWMNGNISKEGIKLDEEWMHRIGLSGFQYFDVSSDSSHVVDKPLIYMTPEWKDAFKYATVLADQFGFEEGIASSPGFSETGGPWVPASEAMKKYVWSETRVEGGKPFTGTLVHPPTKTGAFQDLPIEDRGGGPGMAPFKAPEFYADSAVVAFKVPADEAAADEQQAKITTSGGTIDTTLLSDGDLLKMVSFPKAKAGEKAWIQYEYPQPQTICSLTIVLPSSGPFGGFGGGNGDSGQALEASDDGQNYRVVASIPKGGTTELTISFAPITAKYFRVTFKTLPPEPNPFGAWAELLGADRAKPVTEISLAELVLHPGARVNHFEEKAGFKLMDDQYKFPTPEFALSNVIQKSEVVDLTGKLHADGTLDWTPPAGNWVVLRIGYSLLGITNHPASKDTVGLEVDKLDARYVKKYMDNHLNSYKEAVGADLIGKHGIRAVVTDSWEAGPQNWTDDMIAKFQKYRGHDPRPWLPVLAGHVVESSKSSDQFLWDMRKTVADLIADEHYGQVQASLKEWGLSHYGESHEGGRALSADGMEVKKLDDVPMGAMWTQTPGVNKEQYQYNADDRESASVAHIYGQNLAAAESMTAMFSPWVWSPATLKSTADQEFLNGINRIVIHESAHQPLLGKVPGVAMGPFGQWFNRNETWAEQAHAWIDYLARNAFLLQQGRFAADVVYFYGEDSNITALFGNKAPDVPAGYNFDYINADGLIHELNVSDGQISTANGMRYQVLALDPFSKHMSLPVLRAIHKLVEQGGVVAGQKPDDTPSLADDQAEFKKLNDELFGDGTGVHEVGMGKVYAGLNAEATLKALNAAPDFDYSQPEGDSWIQFVHRKLADGDIYFLNNRGTHASTVNASFRVTGKAPELWYAETGKTELASYKIADGRTTVPLHFEPWGTVFVVFRAPANELSRTLPKPVETQLATVEGSWNLSFQPDRGAPASIALDKLISWSDSDDKGVKYFSGTGTYTKTIEAKADWFKPGARLCIDLGDVKNLAEVTVNGKSLGVVWHAPYRVDVTGVLKRGANELTIKVINSWVNRLIGDEQPDATVRYTFVEMKPYKANSPLLHSGLLGPVTVLRDDIN